MALDVLITPANGAIEFKNNGNVDYHLKNDNGNLHFGGAGVVKSTTLVVAGKDNKSLHFDGTNDNASATTAITDSMPSGTLPRSIEALIKLNGQGSNDGGAIATSYKDLGTIPSSNKSAV